MKIILASILAILSLLSVCFLWENTVLLTVALLAISVSILLIDKSKKDLIVFVFCGLFGAFSEAIAIFFGIWKYSNPHIFGVPFWLPILWGIAAVFIVRLSEFIGSKFERKS